MQPVVHKNTYMYYLAVRETGREGGRGGRGFTFPHVDKLQEHQVETTDSERVRYCIEFHINMFSSRTTGNIEFHFPESQTDFLIYLNIYIYSIPTVIHLQ